MDRHRPVRRKLLTRVAAVGVACTSLFAAGCSGGGGTTVVPHGSGGGSVGSTGNAGGGVPSASAAPSTSPSVAPSSAPSATPTPAAAPTSTPSSGGSGFACSAAPATMNQPYYAEVFLAGNVPANGGAFALDTAISSWTKAEYVPAVPTPTPVATSTPSGGPVPTPPPTRPVYVYSGTYHIDSASAPTDGCLTLLATADGTPFTGYPIDAEGIGFVNPPQAQSTLQLLGSGKIGAVTLSLSPAALPAGGTIALDDGDTGTISIQSVQTVQMPLNRLRKPR
jgi:hypothetical protein